MYPSTSRSWSSGEPGPLPIRIQFFTSRPGNALDTTSVKRAAQTALIAEGLPPDVVVQSAPTRFGAPQRLHLQLEVNVYSGGEVRLEHGVIDAEGVRRGCHSEMQWWTSGDPLGAALTLSHRIRSAVACAQEAYEIEW